MRHSEKTWGNLRSNHQIAAFRNLINHHNLLDIGFKGPKFTWKHGHTFNPDKVERLDRTVANFHWSAMFPKAILWHLPFLKSDHHPILLNTNPFNATTSKFIFIRFERWWSSLPGYKAQIKAVWNASVLEKNWLSLTSNFLKYLHKWGKSHLHLAGKTKGISNELEAVNDDLSSKANIGLQHCWCTSVLRHEIL